MSVSVTNFGGVALAGDDVYNGRWYYQRKVNQTAVAKTRGQLLSTDANGNAIIAPTSGAKGEYYVCYEDTPASALRVAAWHQEGIWLLLPVTADTKPNKPVKPSTTIAGQVEPLVEGTDDPQVLGVGICLGPESMRADLTAGKVVQATTTAGNLAVIEFKRL